MKINVLIQQTISSEFIVELPKHIDPDCEIQISDWIDENWQNWKLEEISNFTDWVSFDHLEAE